MRKVIDAKAYDTSTATELTFAQNPSADSANDFRYWIERLYRTAGGRYFIAGRGGPLSSWSEKTGQNSWSGSSGIRPLSEAQAREWVERWANEDYEKIFHKAESA